MEIPASLSRFALPLDLAADYLKNVSDWSGTIAGVLCPDRSEDIAEIVLVANRLKLKLHPLSGGTNWGFGSRLPSHPQAWILDLSRLRRILQYDAQQGTVTVEPGVTQGDLHRQLRAADSPFVLNVTGSGIETSLVGNLLERGIGYFSQRPDDLLGLSVIRGDGQAFDFPSPEYARLGYSPGLGPDWRGLFPQSDLAIVTRVTLRLIRRSPVMGGFIVTLLSETQLEKFIDALAGILQEGWLHSVPHIANATRLSQSLGTANPPAWMALLPLQGIAGQPALFQAELEKRFPGAQVSWTPGCAAQGISGIAQWLQGHPSNAGLRSIGAEQIRDRFAVDRLPLGVRYLNAMVPLVGTQVTRLSSTLRDATVRLGSEPLGITLNAVSPRAAAAIISLTHERTAGGIDRAERHYQRLCAECRALGSFPYRLSVGMREWYNGHDFSTTTLHRELKGVWDPQGVFV